MYNKSIFIFHRDLRLIDNIGLNECIKNSTNVVCVFIFTPEQISDKNKYKSNNAIQYMVESLIDLNNELKKYKSRLYMFYASTHDAVKYLIKKEKIDAVYSNMDYTPFAIKRDSKIEKVCIKYKIPFILYEDALLNPITSIYTKSDTPYKKFTSYYNAAKNLKIKKPVTKINNNFYKKSIDKELKIENIKKLYRENPNILLHGGRTVSLGLLNKLKLLKNYSKTKDNPNINTSLLSSSLKFGTISIREVYNKLKKLKINNLIKQLYWRDFYYNIVFHYNHVIGSSFIKKYNNLKWSYDNKLFNKWKNGKTGFPIIDAGMRQMNTTGWMHNRVRMLVASFLVKDLHINWMLGEKYFAISLLDYDPSLNNGNWQWCASTGVDSQPYFRIFNPWTQTLKHDKECRYIKKWIPELRNVENKHILKWYKYYDIKSKYPKPCIDHEKEAKKTLVIYKKIVKN